MICSTYEVLPYLAAASLRSSPAVITVRPPVRTTPVPKSLGTLYLTKKKLYCLNVVQYFCCFLLIRTEAWLH